MKFATSIESTSVGQFGSDVFADSSLHTVPSGVDAWCALQCIGTVSAVVHASGLVPFDSRFPAIASITIPLGVTVYGLWTGVQLTSGILNCYRAKLG